MQYTFKRVEVRKYKRIDKKTGEESIVEISNRNGFAIDEQIKLLNLNDKRYRYDKV